MVTYQSPNPGAESSRAPVLRQRLLPGPRRKTGARAGSP